MYKLHTINVSLCSCSSFHSSGLTSLPLIPAVEGPQICSAASGYSFWINHQNIRVYIMDKYLANIRLILGEASYGATHLDL